MVSLLPGDWFRSPLVAGFYSLTRALFPETKGFKPVKTLLLSSDL
jgi:hypothetical protein